MKIAKINYYIKTIAWVIYLLVLFIVWPAGDMGMVMFGIALAIELMADVNIILAMNKEDKEMAEYMRSIVSKT